MGAVSTGFQNLWWDQCPKDGWFCQCIGCGRAEFGARKQTCLCGGMRVRCGCNGENCSVTPARQLLIQFPNKKMLGRENFAK